MLNVNEVFLIHKESAANCRASVATVHTRGADYNPCNWSKPLLRVSCCVLQFRFLLLVDPLSRESAMKLLYCDIARSTFCGTEATCSNWPQQKVSIQQPQHESAGKLDQEQAPDGLWRKRAQANIHNGLPTLKLAVNSKHQITSVLYCNFYMVATFLMTVASAAQSHPNTTPQPLTNLSSLQLLTSSVSQIWSRFSDISQSFFGTQMNNNYDPRGCKTYSQTSS